MDYIQHTWHVSFPMHNGESSIQRTLFTLVSNLLSYYIGGGWRSHLWQSPGITGKSNGGGEHWEVGKGKILTAQQFRAPK